MYICNGYDIMRQEMLIIIRNNNNNSFIIYVPSQQLQANYRHSTVLIQLHYGHTNTYIESKTNYRQALEENTLMRESKPTYKQTKMRDNKNCNNDHHRNMFKVTRLRQ
jgi:hypothetical protein